MPRVIQVIESEETRGLGTGPSDPCRRVMKYYTLDGEFLAERDYLAEMIPAGVLAKRDIPKGPPFDPFRKEG